MFKKIKETTIAARLFASFALVIAIFIAYVVLSTFLSGQITRRHQHNVDFIVARSAIISDFHQEFTEMRRLLLSSFMSESWREFSDYDTWLFYEQRLNNKYMRMLNLSEEFIASVSADEFFPLMPDDRRIILMEEITAYIETIYDIFETNFFLGSEMNFFHVDLLAYAISTDEKMMEMRQLIAANQEANLAAIAQLERFAVALSTIAVILGASVSILLAVLTIRHFNSKLRSVRGRIEAFTEGSFDPGIHVGSDEFSLVFAEMVNMFASFIAEIQYTAEEIHKGNTSARIRESQLKSGYLSAAAAINSLLDVISQSQEREKESLYKLIDAEKRQRVAEQNSQVKSSFLANMSHEIRTPITSVMGIAQLQLQSPDLPMDMEKPFVTIYDSAKMLLTIINDLLDISKIESGKMELIVGEYEIANLITDTLQVQIAYIGSKPIVFKVEADENMPAYLLGDKLRIQQILNNLLSNSFKYTDEGTVKFRTHCEYPDGKHSNGNTCWLNMIVEDTGMGMTESQLNALQSEYTRFHEKEGRDIQGTGLGMSIVNKLINLMGGSIHLKSQPGKGTTVTVRIPQTISGDKKLGKEAAENLHNVDFAVLSGIKTLSFEPEPMPYGSVLIVDDIEANLYVSRGLMGLYGLNIETVSDSIGAINKINEGKVYDIIFMDYMMPGMNGTEAVEIIRHLGYGEPIVALTANTLMGQSGEFMRNGFDGFLSKPIQFIHLNAVLNMFIRNKQPPEVIASAQASAAGAKDNRINIENFFLDGEFISKILKDFVSTHRDIVSEIYAAYESNNYEKALRLAHTLKGIAGFMREDNLASAARRVEESFKAQLKCAQLLEKLGQEVASVLATAKERFEGEPDEKQSEEEFDKDVVPELFDKLAICLSQDSGDVEMLIDDLEKIPHTEELIRKILDFEFDTALEELKKVRKHLNV